MDSFAGLNAQVLGISIDHIPCLQAWAESLGGIHYPLLSDFWPHGDVAERFGVLRPEDGYTERAIFVLDKDGVVRYIDIHAIDDRPNNEEVRKVLRQIAEEDAAKNDAAAIKDVAAKKDAAAVKNPPANVGPLPSAGIYFDEPQEEDAIPQGEIVVYCAQWCKDCRKAKAWLDERRLKYVEVDIDYNMTARNQVRQWANGFLVTPVINFDGAIILDFDPTKLEEALRKRG